MTLERQYEILTNARGHLAKGWMHHRLWGSHDSRYGTGEVCALGAIYRSGSVLEFPEDDLGPQTMPPSHPLQIRMQKASFRLFPEMEDNPYNFVGVNNCLGQAAILAVFDAAIQELETEISQKLVESAVSVELPKLEEVPVVVPY